MQFIQTIQLKSLSKLSGKLQGLTEKRLWLQVLIGLFCGVIVGILIGPDLALVSNKTSLLLASWLALPGHLFLALIQMIVVPLVLASVIRGLTSASDISQLKKLGIYGGGFFLVMTIFSSAVGITIGLAVDPGSYIKADTLQGMALGSQQTITNSKMTLPDIKDLPLQFVGLLPKNPLQSFSAGDMLRIVIFAIVFGIALLSVPAEKSAPLYDLLGSIQEVCMTIVGWAMKIAPFAVFGLLVQITSNVGINVLAGMLVYVLTVISGLFFMGVVYLFIMSHYMNESLFAFIRQCREVLLLAFSTSSSAAVMPLTIKTLESSGKINSATIRFLVPLGATINMSGTALYQSVATVFLASVFGIDLDMTALLFVVTMTVMASMGSPATPGASIVILAMMLESIGIPQAGMALLIGVDRILDMCRTVVNVMGDMAASIVVDHWVKT